MINTQSNYNTCHDTDTERQRRGGEGLERDGQSVRHLNLTKAQTELLILPTAGWLPHTSPSLEAAPPQTHLFNHRIWETLVSPFLPYTPQLTH